MGIKEWPKWGNLYSSLQRDDDNGSSQGKKHSKDSSTIDIEATLSAGIVQFSWREDQF
jgi:adenylate cyclase